MKWFIPLHHDDNATYVISRVWIKRRLWGATSDIIRPFDPPNTYQLVGIIPLRIVLAIITEETRDERMSSMVLITPTWGAFVPPLCAHLSVTEEWQHDHCCGSVIYLWRPNRDRRHNSSPPSLPLFISIHSGSSSFLLSLNEDLINVSFCSPISQNK